MRLEQEGEGKFSVLKCVEKDISLNHDLFLTKEASFDPGQNLTADQIIMFAEKAIAQILEAKKYPLTRFDIDKQILEASFIYRKVCQFLATPNACATPEAVS